MRRLITSRCPIFAIIKNISNLFFIDIFYSQFLITFSKQESHNFVYCFNRIIFESKVSVWSQLAPLLPQSHTDVGSQIKNKDINNQKLDLGVQQQLLAFQDDKTGKQLPNNIGQWVAFSLKVSFKEINDISQWVAFLLKVSYIEINDIANGQLSH